MLYARAQSMQFDAVAGAPVEWRLPATGDAQRIYLPQRYGGLGYRRSEDMKFAAFIGGTAMAAYGPYGIASYFPPPLPLTLIVQK